MMTRLIIGPHEVNKVNKSGLYMHYSQQIVILVDWLMAVSAIESPFSDPGG
jgi:hypothetical protein